MLRCGSGSYWHREKPWKRNTGSWFLFMGTVPFPSFSSSWLCLHFAQLEPDPDLQQSDSWIRIRINLQMTNQNVWNISLFTHFSKVLSLYLVARIRIRIKAKSRIRIRIRNRIKVTSRNRIYIKVTSRIWIRIKVMQIRNTVRTMLRPIQFDTFSPPSPLIGYVPPAWLSMQSQMVRPSLNTWNFSRWGQSGSTAATPYKSKNK